MIAGADFPTAYKSDIKNCPPPVCDAPKCFIGSYPPVTPAGQMGPWFVDTYLLRPDRQYELPGPVAVREKDLRCKN
jgi:hypothetical protein